MLNCKQQTTVNILLYVISSFETLYWIAFLLRSAALTVLSKQMFSRRAPRHPKKPIKKVTIPTIATRRAGSKKTSTWFRISVDLISKLIQTPNKVKITPIIFIQQDFNYINAKMPKINLLSSTEKAGLPTQRNWRKIAHTSHIYWHDFEDGKHCGSAALNGVLDPQACFELR